MTPYWQSDDGQHTLYHGKCEDIMPHLPAVDAVVTDPPYPSYYVEEYKYFDGILSPLLLLDCRQFVFWTPSQPFPLPYQGKRIWDKAVGTCTQFEEIYERNHGSGYKIHRFYSMGCFSSVGAQMTGETITGHPSQKPIGLLMALAQELPKGCTILDPFTGSGTTGVACIRTGRRFIGIEMEERYCEIAAKRMEAELSQPMLIPPARDNPHQYALLEA